MSDDTSEFPHPFRRGPYFTEDSYEEVPCHYVEPWMDQLKSCIVICLDSVKFRGNSAWGSLYTEPHTTNGFFFEWTLGGYSFQNGTGFLTRWDTGEYLLIIPIETDDTFEDD